MRRLPRHATTQKSPKTGRWGAGTSAARGGRSPRYRHPHKGNERPVKRSGRRRRPGARRTSGDTGRPGGAAHDSGKGDRSPEPGARGSRPHGDPTGPHPADTWSLRGKRGLSPFTGASQSAETGGTCRGSHSKREAEPGAGSQRLLPGSRTSVPGAESQRDAGSYACARVCPRSCTRTCAPRPAEARGHPRSPQLYPQRTPATRRMDGPRKRCRGEAARHKRTQTIRPHLCEASGGGAQTWKADCRAAGAGGWKAEGGVTAKGEQVSLWGAGLSPQPVEATAAPHCEGMKGH